MLRTFYERYVIPARGYMMTDCIGGPRPIQLRHLMNAHKGLTFPFFLLLMHYYDNWSVSAFVILADQGTYGLCWLLKDQILPDRLWTKPMTIPSALLGLVAFTAHWCGGYFLISNHNELAAWVLAICISMHTLGLVLMMVADTQKYFVLRYKPGLITDGWFKWCRNTNFLGEFLVYLSYTIMGQHWFPYVFLACMWLFVGVSNMIAKDASLLKKDGGEQYLEYSGFFLPHVASWIMSASPSSASVLPSPTPIGPTVDHVVATPPPETKQ
ncbi:hypothetical protein SDRG_14018 [Saprolegnia diclina VS20]|uniref:Uncharacterized protein n=1 Tax=Saprolegnia diclina (strain VS20) TaxID=1156394 RepID=T0PRS5_SAPDV|nr:hypothetical protein SDRG_14018 [Saprolegnia diclina VS20]EQC28194.1 hypothetical protein SDRG_14018 [Saprolegnia diclina VS20]|eukprot:XP_008618343.1 hypothetical protein SDRG_14018 [Saprolegnia diclina VS20]